MMYYGDGVSSLLSEQWAKLHQSGRDINLFLKARELKNIAIYGRGVWAEQLFQDLQHSEVKIRYLTDSDLEDESMLSIDIIIVTEVENYMDIERKISEKFLIEVISIQELIDKTLRNIRRN